MKNEKQKANRVTLAQRLRAVVLVLAMLFSQYSGLVTAVAESVEAAAPETAFVEVAEPEVAEETGDLAVEVAEALRAPADDPLPELPADPDGNINEATQRETPVDPEEGPVADEAEGFTFEIPLPAVDAELLVGGSVNAEIKQPGDLYRVKLTVAKAEKIGRAHV